MATATKRIRKSGARVYEIRVSRGRDPETKKQLTPYTMTYTPPDSWSDKKAQKEADKVAAQFEADCKAGKVRTKEEERAYQAQLAKEQAKRPTFEQLTQMYIDSRKGVRSANTVENWRVCFRRAGEVLNGYLVEEITPAIMRDYVERLQGEGKNEKNGQPLRYKTVVKHYAILSTMFDFAVEREIIPVSPMQNMKRPKPRKDEEIREREAFTEAEVKYILECACKEPPMDKAMLFFALDSGCRRGEIAGLMWEDIDFKTGRVTICRNGQYTAGKGCYVTTPKNGKSRKLILNAPALAALKEWHREQLKSLMALGLPRTGFVFTADDGGMRNPQFFTSYLRRFQEKYGTAHLNPHKLRHTMATISIANGADIKSVNEKLGHADASITLSVYTHANEEAQNRANKALADAIYNSRTG